jgi:hypothetical protein
MPLSDTTLTPSDFLQRIILDKNYRNIGSLTYYSLTNDGITDECASERRYKYSTELTSVQYPKKYGIPLYHHVEAVWNAIVAHTYFKDEKSKRKWPEAHR